MAVLGVIILILLFIIWLFYTPIDIVIDTRQNIYFIEFKNLVKASIENHNTHFLVIKMQFWFWKYHFYPIKMFFNTKKEKSRKWEKTNFNTFKLLKLLKSFKTKRLYVNIDTGDCIYNAKLYPVFSLLNYYKGSFNINFEGRNQFILHITNRPIDILKSFINLKK